MDVLARLRRVFIERRASHRIGAYDIVADDLSLYVPDVKFYGAKISTLLVQMQL
jgi:hypothetical protein